MTELLGNYIFLLIADKEWRETVAKLREVSGDVVCPKKRIQVRPRRKRSADPVWIEKMLFLGYVALRVDEETPPWAELLEIEGVFEVLAYDEHVLVATKKQLKGMLDNEEQEVTWEGKKVEVSSGPWAGHQGVFQDGKVLLQLFGREVRVRVGVQKLFRV